MTRGAEQLRKPRPVPLMQRIPCERDLPNFSPLAAAYSSLQRTLKLCPTSVEGHGSRIAVHQLGTGDHRRVLVLIHGVLSDHETWRYIAGPLSNDFDLWLVDLPGCGDSEAPDPRVLGPKGYSPGAMAERVLQALEQCLAERKQAPRLYIGAHSLGGMVSLQIGGNPQLRQRFSGVLNQLDGMVLFAPADVAINQENPVFVKIASLRGYEVGIAKALGILGNEAAKADLAGVCSSNNLARETALNLAHVLGDSAHRRAAQAMIRQAVSWKEKEHRPDWASNKALEAHYRNINVPCLIVWGEQDETLPESMGHKLKDSIPGAKLLTLPECMHSPHLECPTRCAQIISEFLQNKNAVASSN